MSWWDRDLSVWFDEAKEEGNPYLTEWFAAAAIGEKLMTDPAEALALMSQGKSEFMLREMLVSKYSWAVPCKAALDVVASMSPLIEPGAGTGYWAWLLRKRGVDIAVYDLYPPPFENHYHKSATQWVQVEQGGPDVCKRANGRTLFLCWPPYAEPMALDCLQAYSGKRLVFVGEHGGGCTGCEKFWTELESDWTQTATVDLPQYTGLHDYLGVWERN